MGLPMRKCFANGRMADAIIITAPCPQQRATTTGSQTMPNAGLLPHPSALSPALIGPALSIPLLPSSCLFCIPARPPNPRRALWVTLTSN